MTNPKSSRSDEVRIHSHLVVRRDGPVAILRIDRRERLGALNMGMLEQLASYAATIANTDDTRVLIITGTGRSFVAGADIEDYHGASQAEFDAFQRCARQTFESIARLPQITICAINGHALGGGLELALCCDFILACKTARLGLPEIKLGLLPGGGGTQRLARLVGLMRAKTLVLTGRVLGAEEAAAWNLVSELHTPDDLMPRTLALAHELCQQAPLALIAGKQVINDGAEAPLSTALTLEQRVLATLFASADGKEGIAAFIAKRQPRFHGH